MENQIPQRLTTPEAAKYVGLSASLLNKLRCRGGGPTFLKLCDRVLYDRTALDAWLAENTRRSTSEYQTEAAGGWAVVAA